MPHSVSFSSSMDPLNSSLGITDADTLPSWQDVEVRAPYPDYVEERESRLPVRQDINTKVALWEGDITKFKAAMIVNSSNEGLNDKNPVSERIHRVAGHLLRDECRSELISCRTGEAKMTKGYNLPARYVAHTVGPRYNTKYRTAAESALYMCYRNVLQLAREYNLNTIGMAVVNTTRRGYPPEEGAHIGLRTVRKFLEKNLEVFDKIIFVVEPIDESIYRRLMPLYFPRTKKEEQYAIDLLPTDLGNEDGEPYIAERQIRIISKPLKQLQQERNPNPLPDEDDDDVGIDLMNSFVGRHPFSAVAGDHDQTRQAHLHGRTSEEIEAMEQQRRYARWLKRSRTEDFSDYNKLGFLYSSGSDYLGRPVVVIVGRRFNVNQIDLNKAVSYFVHVMDSIASRDYVIIYFNTLTGPNNHLDLGFLKDLYDIVDIKYKMNLKALYVIHGTMWARVVCWFFTMFSAAAIRQKVEFLGGVRYLYDSVNPDQLDIPSFINDYDIKENGMDYHNPNSQRTITM